MKNQLRTGIFLLTLLSLAVSGCQKASKQAYKEVLADTELYHSSVKILTDIIVHDIFSPPVASRIYVYPNIAAYEILVHENPAYQSLAGQLNGFTAGPAPDKSKPMDLHLAAIHAFLNVGKTLIFSEDKLEEFRQAMYEKIKLSDIPDEVFENSLAYGDQMATHILEWAAKDNYKQTRSAAKYTIRQEDALWKPTPPDYMEGIEPHWMEIRTLVLDSANQFAPVPPSPFSMDKNSKFYKETMEVYETGKNLTDTQREIAKFWDCNPYVSTHKGHAMFATKKITPGGHWMGITAITCRQTKSDFMRTAEAYTLVSTALFDGFISCWDEKWRSIVIRPETVINQYIDEDWVPLLQTPPFPEYTSGHSVISNSSAAVLTNLYGDTFHFNDTTEMEYGLPAREFDSFTQASEEAAISRMYGGIHYRPAIEVGVTQGRAVGSWVVANLKTKRTESTK